MTSRPSARASRAVVPLRKLQGVHLLVRIERREQDVLGVGSGLHRRRDLQDGLRRLHPVPFQDRFPRGRRLERGKGNRHIPAFDDLIIFREEELDAVQQSPHHQDQDVGEDDPQRGGQRPAPDAEDAPNRKAQHEGQADDPFQQGRAALDLRDGRIETHGLGGKEPGCPVRRGDRRHDRRHKAERRTLQDQIRVEARFDDRDSQLRGVHLGDPVPQRKAEQRARSRSDHADDQRIQQEMPHHGPVGVPQRLHQADLRRLGPNLPAEHHVDRDCRHQQNHRRQHIGDFAELLHVGLHTGVGRLVGAQRGGGQPKGRELFLHALHHGRFVGALLQSDRDVVHHPHRAELFLQDFQGQEKHAEGAGRGDDFLFAGADHQVFRTGYDSHNRKIDARPVQDGRDGIPGAEVEIFGEMGIQEDRGIVRGIKVPAFQDQDVVDLRAFRRREADQPGADGVQGFAVAFRQLQSGIDHQPAENSLDAFHVAQFVGNCLRGTLYRKGHIRKKQIVVGAVVGGVEIAVSCDGRREAGHAEHDDHDQGDGLRQRSAQIAQGFE